MTRQRGFTLVWALLAASLAAGLCAADDLPLPQWGEAERYPGAGFNNLLPPPPEFQVLTESGPRLEDEPPELQYEYSDLAPHDLALFLHGSVLKPGAPVHEPTSAVALRDLPEELLQMAYRTQEREYLIDPQGLVTEVLKADLERLLKFHGDDARVKLFVLVMDENQKLPERAVLDRIAGGALTRQDACLVVYPLGEPWRARFLVSKSVHQAAPVQSLTEMAEDCTQDALRAADSGEQLQRFAIRLSTRLFRLEKFLPAAMPHQSAPLQEVVQAAAKDAAPEAGGSVWTVVCAWGILLGLTGGTGWFLWRSRNRRDRQLSHVWVLPDLETIPRLGGNFSGGTSAVIHYGPQGRAGC